MIFLILTSLILQRKADERRMKDDVSSDTVRPADWFDTLLIWVHIHLHKLSASHEKRIWKIFHLSAREEDDTFKDAFF